MPSYDPQRNRPRQRPSDDEPAAVDALLDAADVEPADPAGRGDDVHGHDHGHHHDHDHDHHDHDHDHHDHDDDMADIALVPIVAMVGALAGVLVIVWRWRRRKAV